MRHPAAAHCATVLASLLLAAGGCSRAPERTPSNEAASPAPAASPSPAALAAVTLPDLAAVASPVRQQLRARFDALTAVLADTSRPATEQAARFGDLGHVLSAATFFEEAVLCYRHAEALEPREAKWPYLRGHASLRQGDRDFAAQAFERTVALQPGYVPALVWLGDTYLDLGRAADAQAAFAKALAVEPESAAALFGAGRAALAGRAFEDAVRQFEHALRADPHATVINYPLAMAYRGTGQAERAEQLLQRRGTSAPQMPDPLLQQADVVLDSAVSYEALGMQALRAQDWVGAAKAFRRGLDVAPGDASLRYWMATAMIASGDVAGAEREFRTVVERQPDFAKAHFSLGAVLDQRGQKADALREYEAAVRYAPTMPEARLRLGDTFRALNRHQAALAEYQEAVKLDPTVAAAWLGGAQTLIALGKTDLAREWIERGRTLHPTRREWDTLAAQLR